MKGKEIFMYVLGSIIIIGFFAVLIYMIKNGGYKNELGIILGALVGAFGTVVGYFYGSSKGSSDKNDLMKGNQNV